jgi:hypothetical protein
MAKKNLKDPSEGNKNIRRGIDVLINPVDGQQKEKEAAKINSFDTENVSTYTLRIPNNMFEKLKYDLAKEKKASMRDLILKAIQEYYKI